MTELTHETVLQGFRLSPKAVATGVLVSIGLHALAIGFIFAVSAAISAVSEDEEDERPRVVRVIDAKFVKLGEKLPPRKLPNKLTPQRTTAPMQEGKAVSKRPQEPPPDAGPTQPSAEQDLLTRLGNRAKVLSDLEQVRNQEGSPEGIEEGTEEEGDANAIYLGQLYAFFRRGFNMPTGILESERPSLRTTALVEITNDGHVGNFRIVNPSGNADFDQAVRLRLEQAQGSRLPSPPEELADQYLGQNLQIPFVPPRN